MTTSEYLSIISEYIYEALGGIWKAFEDNKGYIRGYFSTQRAPVYTR